MIRFCLIVLIWMALSFLLLWWVQAAVDSMHRHSAELVGRAVNAQSNALPEVVDDEKGVLAQVLQKKRVGPEDLQRIQSDRNELMRRLRILWIALTLGPPLVAGWFVVRKPPACFVRNTDTQSLVNGIK